MLPYGRKNPLPFPYSLSSANFAVPSQGKGVIHKRVENRRLSTLLCARAASAQCPRRDRRRSLRFASETLSVFIGKSDLNYRKPRRFLNPVRHCKTETFI